mmetsp:Transcript_28176/g.66950  ORF Transcript_28176/g.66950 Transcript_28176/m.66950 type:complete len:269 (+) Transcript_28176:1523-2329(+)
MHASGELERAVLEHQQPHGRERDDGKRDQCVDHQCIRGPQLLAHFRPLPDPKCRAQVSCGADEVGGNHHPHAPAHGFDEGAPNAETEGAFFHLLGSLFGVSGLLSVQRAHATQPAMHFVLSRVGRGTGASRKALCGQLVAGTLPIQWRAQGLRLRQRSGTVKSGRPRFGGTLHARATGSLGGLRRRLVDSPLGRPELFNGELLGRADRCHLPVPDHNDKVHLCCKLNLVAHQQPRGLGQEAVCTKAFLDQVHRHMRIHGRQRVIEQVK